MAAAAGTALFRSMASKMAPALPPHRVITARGLTSSGVGRSSPNPSRSSTSSGSEGPQTHNNKDPSGSGWYRAIVAFNEAASIAAFFLVGGIAFMHFRINPSLDRLEADLEAQSQAWVTMREEIKKSHERTRALLASNKKSQIEAADVSEGKRITGIGTNKHAA